MLATLPASLRHPSISPLALGRRPTCRLPARIAVFALAGALPLLAADKGAAQSVARIEVQPERLEVAIGETASFEVIAYDAGGDVLEFASEPFRIAAPRTGVRVEVAGERRGGRAPLTVTGLAVGEYDVAISSGGGGPTAASGAVLRAILVVEVRWPAVARVEISGDAFPYLGSTVLHRVQAFHADGSARPYPEARWASSASEIASVDPFGNVRARSLGEVAITASVEGVEGRATYRIRRSPVAELKLEGGIRELRTGDVQNFEATALAADGSEVTDAPVGWSFAYQPDDSVKAPAGPARIENGRMVADVPGLYTAVASSGAARAEYSFRVASRNAVRKLAVVGQGSESRVFTTDIWIWEGVDGRDYAMTGSKMGDGVTFVWDVTDPANIYKTDSVFVDARTTNDVKVSPDGRYGAISREGASDRRNGVVLLDLADPAHPRIASTYDGGLTGGVHNMFATDTHLFALSGGDKYVILDVADLESPRYVSEYNHPGSRVHDVWVHDGLAYSAEWGAGVVVVDVGNGRWGGTIENPKLVTTFPTTTGSTHAVFPYWQESTGRFLLIVGDERVHRRGLAWEGTGPDHRVQYDPATGRGGYPRATSGYTQIFDFTDPENPVQLARYEVSEYGTHNMWAEDDILYQAYYEGGVRMVDISGDLMGNLYTQGREIAVIKAHDPVGYVPNSPGAWSVIPWKGNIFFSDINSGVWAVRLEPKTTPIS